MQVTFNKVCVVAVLVFVISGIAGLIHQAVGTKDCSFHMETSVALVGAHNIALCF